MSTEATDRAPTEPEHVARGLAAEAGNVAQGQRRINLIWEITQAFIAVSVTVIALGKAANLTPPGGDAALIGNAFFLVVGFYFGRTNHQRIGGVGPIDGR